MPFYLPDNAMDLMAAFLLVFFRMTGVMMAAPLLSSQSTPIRIRAWFAFMLAVVAFPVVRSQMDAGTFVSLFRSEVLATLSVASEVAVGWTIGFTASLTLYAAQLAGHLVGQEVGLAIGEVFDPVSQTTSSPYANLFLTTGTVIFVLLNGHLMLFEAVIATFRVAPIGSFLAITPSSALLMARDFGSEIFSLGLRLALPTVLALLLATVSMAILARAVPEMNIFIVGFSIRIIVGLFVVVILVPFAVSFMVDLVHVSEEYLQDLHRAWARG